MRSLLLFALLLCVAALLAAGPGVAQTNGAPANAAPGLPASPPGIPRAVEDPGDPLLTVMWDKVKSVAGWVGSVFTPASPVDYVLDARRPDPNSFRALMEAAGYRLEDFETGVSLIPTRRMVFRLVRELSEADIIRLEQRLKLHEAQIGGPSARIKRMIVRTLLDAQDIGGSRITTVTVAVMPIPYVQYGISDGTARDAAGATRPTRPAR